MKNMKKILLVILLVIGLVLTKENVSAISYGTPTPNCTEKGNEMVCKIDLIINEKMEGYNAASINFEVINLNVISFTPEKSWFVDSETTNGDKNSYILKTTKTTLEAGTHTVATVKLSKKDILARCYFKLSPIFLNKEERNCSIYQGVYYGKDGNIVSAIEYDKQCNTHVCEILSDGTYFGKNGTIVDSSTYLSECGHICEYYDGKYYGKNGMEVNQSIFNQECSPKCKFENGKYYGQNGSVVSELDYQKQCGNNVCSILSDGTIYGKDGKVVDALTYQKQCGNNVCSILSDGTIYGKDGKVVDQATFDKECKDPKYCKFEDGKYYDREGKEVDKLEYQIQCEKHVCEQIENNFFDKNGNLVSEEEYKKQCSDNPICRKVGETYYGKDGTPTSKEKYDQECSMVVENPKTGAFVPIIIIISSGLLGYGILHFAKKYDRFI